MYQPAQSKALKKITGKAAERHRAFLIEYWTLRHAGKAYAKVYKTTNMNTAYSNGSKILKNAKIQEVLEEMDAEFWEERQSLRGETLLEAHKLAHSDINDVADFDRVNGLVVKNFNEVDTRTIQSIKQIETETKSGDIIRTTEIKLHPKSKTLADKMQALKMVDPKEPIDINVIIKPAKRPNKKEKGE